MMKKLLLLVLIAVARDATAEDTKCIRERATMIETIRAYARADASLLGPQGISESVLEAMGQTERHRFIPGGFLLGRIRGQAGIYRPRSDNITALHSRLDDSFR